MNIIKNNYFSSPIYIFEKLDWLKKLNNLSDKYIKEAYNRPSNYSKDFGTSINSTELKNDNDFKIFKDFVCNLSFDILNNQGFLMEDYFMNPLEIWVQEFSKNGGGHQNIHVHPNAHISGFYFLKCSEKTSYPVFHDSRKLKNMTQLKEKDINLITEASDKIHIKPKPGMFIFFNSYLEHEFVVDHGIEPFRFIHFNIQAISKDIIK